MALIDHANFDFQGQKIFAWECPERNLSTSTQLNVRPGQEALLVLGGSIEQKFPPNGARPYTLDTANLPVVRKLFGIPFGGSNPLLATVWFINKADLVDMELQSETFLLPDPAKPQGFPAIAIVNMGIRVVEAETFFLKLVNGNPCFSANDMREALKGRITRIVTEKMAQLVAQHGLTAADLSTQLTLISNQTRDVVAERTEELGLEFVDFNVRLTQDTSPKGLMMASGYGTDVDTFERQRILDMQEKVLSGLSGEGNGLLGAVLAAGMIGNMNAQSRRAQATSQPQTQQGDNAPRGQQPQAPNARMIYCGNCGRRYDAMQANFCPACGKQYMPCPRCGSDNLPGSRRCVNCGTMLHTASAADSMVCSRCGAQVEAGANFCPKCGNKIG